MATLGIRRNAWESLSGRDQTIFRFMGEKLALGVPARFLDASANEWFVFDDTRFKAKHMCYFGCVAANLGEIPGGYTLPMDGGSLDRAQLVQDIKTFCENPARTNPLVLPKDIEFVFDDPNPWQTLLDAQGTPNSIRMASGVPPSWTPVVVEP